MKRVEELPDKAFRVFVKGTIEMVLFILALIGILAFLASSASAAGSPVRNCQEDYGFDHGCKIDRLEDGQFECDGELIDVSWYNDYELMEFSSSVGISLVAAKAGQGYEDHFFDPPVFEEFDLTAFQGRKHSHDLFCWDNPEPPVGSCCFDCVEESGDADTCEDEAAEAWCDEEGGVFALNTPCGERQDCNDECPMTPVGAICTPPGWPPSDDPDPEAIPCVDKITLAACGDLFNEEYCAAFWDENGTCKDRVCSVPVPTMTAWWYIALCTSILAAALYILYRRRHERG